MPQPGSPRPSRASNSFGGRSASNRSRGVGAKSASAESRRGGSGSRSGGRSFGGGSSSGERSDRNARRGSARFGSVARGDSSGRSSGTRGDASTGAKGSRRRVDGGRQDERRGSTGSSRGRAFASRNTGSAGGRYGSTERDAEAPAVFRKGWGSVARKGAGSINRTDRPRKSEAEEDRRLRPGPDRDEWVLESPDEGRVKSGGGEFVGAPLHLPPDAIREIESRAGKRADRLIKYLREAAKAYAGERWPDAKRSLKPLLAEVAEAPIVQELNGMILYRTQKWAAALKELEASHMQTLSYDLHPAMMDCARALKNPEKVEELWNDMRLASPEVDVMAEGRIVYAAFLAEEGRVQDAIRLLEKASKPRGSTKLHHLRTWYVLGDLYEKAGDVGKARTTFERIAQQDPDLADVQHRIALLA